MQKVLSNLYHTTLAYIFYYLGDIFWRIPTNLGYILYGKCMVLSVKYDDLAGNKIWKVPEEQYNKKV
jgi:hypothetical protein